MSANDRLKTRALRRAFRNHTPAAITSALFQARMARGHMRHYAKIHDRYRATDYRRQAESWYKQAWTLGGNLFGN